MQLGSIFVNFGANTSGFTSGINDMKRSMSLFSGSAPALMAGVGAAIAGVAVVMGVMAVKAAADFQQGLNRLVTGAGDTTDNMQKMGAAIRGISQDTGVLTDQLLPAMYQIISAGQRGAAAEDTLAVAAKGAQAEQAKVVDVAKALTTAMTDYGTAQFNATQFMNGYTRAVQLGKLSLEQLSTSMGPLLPLAKNLGIHFQDVAAAMSTMTNAGVPVERAATSLRFMFQSLENPTKKATTAMTDFGLNTVAVADEMKKSLPGALQMIYDAAKKAGPEGSVPFNRAVSDMIGGQRSLQAFLSLTGSHFKTFKDDVAAVAAAMGVSKTALLGWDIAQQNFNVQLDKAKASFQGLLITIGSLLLPVLTQLLAQIGPIIQSIISWFSNTDNLVGVVSTLTYYLQPLISAVQDTWTYLQPLIQGVIDWAQKNDVAGKALVVVQAAVQFLAAALRFIVPVIVQVIQAVIQFVSALWDRLGPAILTIVAFIRTHWSQIATIFQGVWDIITAAVKVAWSVLSGIILVGIDILQGHWGKAWDDIKQTFVNVWEGIKQAAIGAVKVILGVIALLPGAVGDAAKAALKWLDSLNKAAPKSALDTQKAVVANLQTMVNGLKTQLDNATSANQRKFIQMKLDAAQASLDLQKQVLANMQGLVDGSNKKLKTMADDALTNSRELKKNVINKLLELNNDAVGHSIIPNMVTAITKCFVDMAAAALSWGSTLIDNFKAGLQAAWAGLIAWVNTALANLAAMFPASPVKAGPLKGSEKWGYTFMKNIADGMAAGLPLINAAMAGLLGGTGMGSMNISHSFSGSMASPPAFMGSGGGQPVIINKIYVSSPDLYIDKHKLTDIMGEEITRSVITQTGFRRFNR